MIPSSSGRGSTSHLPRCRRHAVAVHAPQVVSVGRTKSYPRRNVPTVRIRPSTFASDGDVPYLFRGCKKSIVLRSFDTGSGSGTRPHGAIPQDDVNLLLHPLDAYSIEAAAQPAHPADTAVRPQDRWHFTNRFCANTCTHLGSGAADGQAVGRNFARCHALPIVR